MLPFAFWLLIENTELIKIIQYHSNTNYTKYLDNITWR